MAEQSTNQQKTISVKVTVQAPDPEPNYQFLSRRVNTKMTFCGDIEDITTNDEEIKLVMASGHLNIFIDNKMKETLPFAAETSINKNVCVSGYLTNNKDVFEIYLSDAAQIFLSGH